MNRLEGLDSRLRAGKGRSSHKGMSKACLARSNVIPDLIRDPEQTASTVWIPAFAGMTRKPKMNTYPSEREGGNDHVLGV